MQNKFCVAIEALTRILRTGHLRICQTECEACTAARIAEEALNRIVPADFHDEREIEFNLA